MATVLEWSERISDTIDKFGIGSGLYVLSDVVSKINPDKDLGKAISVKLSALADGFKSGKLDPTGTAWKKDPLYTSLTSELAKIKYDFAKASDVTNLSEIVENVKEDLGDVNKTIKDYYTVKHFSIGTIVSGKVDSTDSSGGVKRIKHWAEVYDILGNNKTSALASKLVWRVNNGRSTAPAGRSVPGAVCYITDDDIVKPTDGSAPYYDIQLERLT